MDSYNDTQNSYVENNIPTLLSFIPDLKKDEINFVYIGNQDYLPTWELQKYLHTLRKNKEIPDVVLLLEHNNVYTFGKNADKNYLLDSHPEAEIFQTDRQMANHPKSAFGFFCYVGDMKTPAQPSNLQF